MFNTKPARVLALITFFVGLGAYPEANAPVAPKAAGGFAPPTSIRATDPSSAAASAAVASNGQPSQPGQPVPGQPQAPTKPYRTFITLMRYTMEQNGEVSNPVSNVRLDVTWPNKSKLPLPDATQFWPIGNGQVQEINRTYEVPWAYVQNDGFKFEVQMVRKGTTFLPCQFTVEQLSQFNRSYVCHTDLNWQMSQQLPPEKLDKEGIQVRVFTDLNSEPKDVPNDAIALK